MQHDTAYPAVMAWQRWPPATATGVLARWLLSAHPAARSS